MLPKLSLYPSLSDNWRQHNGAAAPCTATWSTQERCCDAKFACHHFLLVKRWSSNPNFASVDSPLPHTHSFGNFSDLPFVLGIKLCWEKKKFTSMTSTFSPGKKPKESFLNHYFHTLAYSTGSFHDCYKVIFILHTHSSSHCIMICEAAELLRGSLWESFYPCTQVRKTN